MRFFVRVRDNPKAGNYGQPLSLHRFSEDGKTSQFWSRENERWEFSPGTIGFTGLGGGTDLFEVDPVRAYTVFVGVLGGDPETAQSVLGIRLPEEALASGTVSGLASGTAVEEFDSPPTGTASAQAAEVEVRGVLRRVFRHYGPGAHPGTGTEQQVHAGGGGQAARIAKPLSEEDAIHVFEQAGLFKGPYRFVGIWESPPRSLAAANPMAYNAMMRDHPHVDIGGVGSCAYCGTYIVTHCVIQSADKKKFFVGNECVNKTGDEGLTSKVKTAMREIRRERDRKRARGQAWQLIALMSRDDVREALSKEPHPNEYFAKKGLTLFDYYGYFTGPGMSLSKSKWILKKLGELGFEAGEAVEGDWEQIRPKIKVRHYGPGPHPGTGTDQAVHGGDGGEAYKIGEAISTVDAIAAARKDPNVVRDAFGAARFAQAIKSVEDGFRGEDGHSNSRVRGVIRRGEREARPRSPAYPERFFGGHDYWILANGDAVIVDSHDISASEAIAGLEWFSLLPKGWTTSDVTPEGLMAAMGLVRYSTSGTRGIQVGPRKMTDEQTETISAMLANVNSVENMQWNTVVPFVAGNTLGMANGDDGVGLADLLRVRHYGPGPHPGTGTSQEVHAGAEASAGEGGKIRDVTPSEYRQAFEAHFQDSPYTHHVSHYSEEELAQMKAVMLSEDGKTGMVVKDHGDGRIEGSALFNGGERGAGRTLLLRAVKEHGVNYAECYGPVLPQFYARLGFEVTEKVPFDPSLADPDWDHAKFDSPDYYFMRLKGTQAH